MSEEIVRRFEESVERYKADPNKADRVDFHWWEAEDFIPIAKKVIEIGKGFCRIRIYQGIKEDGHTPEIWFRVHDLTEEAIEDKGIWTYNVSHPCPPDCGGG